MDSHTQLQPSCILRRSKTDTLGWGVTLPLSSTGCVLCTVVAVLGYLYEWLEDGGNESCTCLQMLWQHLIIHPSCGCYETLCGLSHSCCYAQWCVHPGSRLNDLATVSNQLINCILHWNCMVAVNQALQLFSKKFIFIHFGILKYDSDRSINCPTET